MMSEMHTFTQLHNHRFQQQATETSPVNLWKQEMGLNAPETSSELIDGSS